MNELAELNNCTHCVFFEARKPFELFLWISECPSGPSVKFHVQSIYSIDEMNTLGNFTIGSRPILSFDSSFSNTESGQSIQKLLTDVFNTPAGHRKGDRYSFFDHVIHFSRLDGKIWFRQYQIHEGKAAEISVDGLSFEEIGPRFILNPIKLFNGSFGGQTVWANNAFVTPAAIKASKNQVKSNKYVKRIASLDESKRRKQESTLGIDEHSKLFE